MLVDKLKHVHMREQWECSTAMCRISHSMSIVAVWDQSLALAVWNWGEGGGGGAGKRPWIHVECMLFFCFLPCRKCHEEKLFVVVFLLVFVDGLHVNMQVGVAYLFTFRHVKSCNVATFTWEESNPVSISTLTELNQNEKTKQNKTR